MDVIVIDDQPPEVVAMLQALYSRSPTTVREHLKDVLERGSEKFMSRFYVGYGHKSIGDCGTTSIFVENVSMLAAKAIQDSPLYNGQEASTRYLDMAQQGIVDPVNTPASAKIQQTWMSLYSEALSALIDHFESRFPRTEEQKPTIWKKAVKARAFDVARSLLPAGCRTYVAWHTNLRQAADHLKLMRHNPCQEIRSVAEAIREELLKAYPSSFGHKTYEDQERYLSESVAAFSFYDAEPGPFRYTHTLNLEALARQCRLLETRPPKTELHHRFRQYGMIHFSFGLDFGSFRDLQRHRSCVQEMPLLTTKHGFYPWYLDQFPDSLREKVIDTCALQEARLDLIDCPPEEKQYYIAMGYNVPIRIACPLPSAVYIAELRSDKTVHPTLRAMAQRIGGVLRTLVPGLTMHHDESNSTWDIKRGNQDIVRRES